MVKKLRLTELDDIGNDIKDRMQEIDDAFYDCCQRLYRESKRFLGSNVYGEVYPILMNIVTENGNLFNYYANTIYFNMSADTDKYTWEISAIEGIDRYADFIAISETSKIIIEPETGEFKNMIDIVNDFTLAFTDIIYELADELKSKFTKQELQYYYDHWDEYSKHFPEGGAVNLPSKYMK